MTPFHAAVWIDHREAKVFHIDELRFDESLIHAKSSHLREDPTARDQFYHHVAEAIGAAGEVLVVGPGTAKLELLKHMQKHDKVLSDKVVGLETVDHPTDKQLVSYARKYFHKEDRMRGLVP